MPSQNSPRPQQRLQPQPQQSGLPLEPQPEQVLEEAELMRVSLGYWRRRFPSLEAVQADPLSSRLLFACAHGRLRAKLRSPKK